MLSYGVGYLLLRELPIRNLYARAWIMLAFLTHVSNTAPIWIGKGIKVVKDPFTDKDIKNFSAYQDNIIRDIPSF